MFTQLSNNASTNNVEFIKEVKVDGSWENASYYGAFSVDKEIRFRISIPTSMGVQGMVLRINRDGEDYWDVPMNLTSFWPGREEYSVELNLRTLCGPVPALFFYEFLFLRGLRTLFTSSINNYDFSLTYSSGSKFSLLVHDEYFKPKEWFGKGIMYHVFVDRFAKGEIAPYRRDDIVINEDWYNGVPQYAKNQQYTQLQYHAKLLHSVPSHRLIHYIGPHTSGCQPEQQWSRTENDRIACECFF